MEKQKRNGWGIASLVCGLAGFITPYVGIVVSICAIVFYAMQKKYNGPSGMATAGLVLGIIGAIFNIVMWGFILFFVSLVGLGAAL